MKHVAILIPGLGDRIPRHQWLTRSWKKEGIDVITHTAPWNTTEEHLEPKLNRLLKHIDQLAQPQTKITLIGTSAGGSLAINAFVRRKSKIHKIISVCGRVRKGTDVFPSLEIAAREFQAFAESVVACEKELSKLTKKDKAKIMTVRCFLFDAIVPMSCIQIPGTANIQVPIPFHVLGIAFSLTLWRKKLIAFLEDF